MSPNPGSSFEPDFKNHGSAQTISALWAGWIVVMAVAAAWGSGSAPASLDAADVASGLTTLADERAAR